MAKDQNPLHSDDLNRDPISGAPGAHPAGTGLGATGGAIAGGVLGAAGGPAGAAAGVVVGGLLGGLGGKAVAERVNPTAERKYWEGAYRREPYYEAGRPYDDYGPAYELGWTSRNAAIDEFAVVEPELAREWAGNRRGSSLDWERARPASHAAWERADRLYFREEDMAIPEGDPLSNEEVVDVLNGLLEITRDGEYGFRACAEEVKTARLKEVFASRAAQCQAAASQLVELVITCGGEPAGGGTASGAMHRGWVHVKGAVGANSELSILEECERGEDAAVARYRKALKQALPLGVRQILQLQAQGAQRNHDQIRDLRNIARQAKARN